MVRDVQRCSDHACDGGGCRGTWRACRCAPRTQPRAHAERPNIVKRSTTWMWRRVPVQEKLVAASMSQVQQEREAQERRTFPD